MTKLNTLQELPPLREKFQQALAARAQAGPVIYVGMGTCGIAAGAREVSAAIQQELSRRGIEAKVGIVGCIGICSKEPLVDIQQAGRPRITYANVQVDMVPRLIQQQLVEGRPVKEWVVGRLPVD